MARCLTILLAGLICATSAAAKAPLAPLPPDKVAGLAELLRQSEIALVESQPGGRLKQVSLFAFVAAPPQQVHDTVAAVERYGEFFRNMSECRVTRNSDGTVDQRFVVRYSLVSFNGVLRSRFLAAPEGSAPGTPGVIDQEPTDPEDNAHFRWEFHETPGGTVMAVYGFTDVYHSNDLIRALLRRAPSMEHGLALAQQLVQVRTLKARAEKLAGPRPPPPRGKSPGFGFLVQRGQVVVLRTGAGGRLADLSLIDQFGAPKDKIAGVVLAPAAFASLVEATTRSEERSRGPEGVAYDLETSLTVASWGSRWLARSDGNGNVDGLCTDGDLKGGRYRWDLTTNDRGTLVVYRSGLDLGVESLVMRTLFGQEPLFEHGMVTAFALAMVGGVKARAEGRR